MFALWGEAKAVDFLKRLREGGVRLADGNSSAVRMVAKGEAALCMTDTDDVWVAQKRGWPVEVVYPSMGEGLGTLWIPNTVAIVEGEKPHGQRAGSETSAQTRDKIRWEAGSAALPAKWHLLDEPAQLDLFRSFASIIRAARGR